MATYIVFGNFTEQGIRNAKDSPKRKEAFKEMAKQLGVTVKDLYWTSDNTTCPHSRGAR